MGGGNEVQEFGSTGVASSTAAGRVSYVLGITGTAISIDTACSSSLVALVYGAKSVERGEEGMALCFGVQALCNYGTFLSFGKAGMLSPDGRCKTFDKSANGYVRGEGCGAVLVKQRERGEEAGLARVAGHAVNQDGRSNGLTAPNGPSQVKLIREALSGAGMQGSEVGMLEAHGTGTSLGDPIEVQAVAEAMGRGRGEGSGLVMGSAKTNFGHTETAAGVLGVLKAVLCMEHGEVARHLHMRELNEFIGTGAMEEMSSVVALEGVEWRVEKRVAGVSSFGFSGTNAHVIVERGGADGGAATTTAASAAGAQMVVRVSAKSEAAMRNVARSYASLLQETSVELEDVALASLLQRSVWNYSVDCEVRG
jgi:acyl transferase domain-containing protein